MPTYLIKLTPLDKFFFGQKNTFGDNKAKYFVRSSHFPQQTTLLGLLRYRLLQVAGDEVFKDNQIACPILAGEEIGKQSFSPFELQEQSFGKIKSLSPVFIMDKLSGEYFVPVGKRYKRVEDQTYKLLSLSHEEGYPPLLEGYSPKEDLLSCWMSAKGETLLSEEDFFEADERIGIRKDYKGATQDDAFFRQTFYKFKNFKKDKDTVTPAHFCFATLLETNEELNFLKNEKSIVYLGGERQPFVMEVSEKTLDLSVKQSALTSDKQHYTVILQSDALIKSDQLPEGVFGITSLKDFACLLTNIGAKRFYNVGKKRYPNLARLSSSDEQDTQDKVEVALSLQQELYAAGSVFYFKDRAKAESFCKAIESNANFYKIGYNHAIIIKPSETEK